MAKLRWMESQPRCTFRSPPLHSVVCQQRLVLAKISNRYDPICGPPLTLSQGASLCRCCLRFLSLSFPFICGVFPVSDWLCSNMISQSHCHMHTHLDIFTRSINASLALWSVIKKRVKRSWRWFVRVVDCNKLRVFLADRVVEECALSGHGTLRLAATPGRITTSPSLEVGGDIMFDWSIDLSI